MTDRSPAPRLSVVSVNYGTLDYLRACLHALAASTLQPEFIVVDNDGSAAPLAREFPHIRLLPQTQNRFFCGGNNIGIRAARGHYLLLTHALPDQLPLPWRRRINARHWYAGWERDSDRDVEVLPGSCLLMRCADLWLDEDLLLYTRKQHGPARAALLWLFTRPLYWLTALLSRPD